MDSDAGNSDVPKKSHEVLPLSEKVKALDLIRKEKKIGCWVCWDLLQLLSVKFWSRKNIHTSFAVTPQTLKVMAIVCGKCMVKKKAHIYTVR